MKTCLWCILLLITTASIDVRQSRSQQIHIIAGQAGVNPGAGLFTIAEKEGLYKKHGLDVEIIQTNTTAAVQAMLAGKMQIATGAGAAAFITAQMKLHALTGVEFHPYTHHLLDPDKGALS